VAGNVVLVEKKKEKYAALFVAVAWGLTTNT
jgi:IMP dehydrogenase/GMP reductase